MLREVNGFQDKPEHITNSTAKWFKNNEVIVLVVITKPESHGKRVSRAEKVCVCVCVEVSLSYSSSCRGERATIVKCLWKDTDNPVQVIEIKRLFN